MLIEIKPCSTPFFSKCLCYRLSVQHKMKKPVRLIIKFAHFKIFLNEENTLIAHVGINYDAQLCR